MSRGSQGARIRLILALLLLLLLTACATTPIPTNAAFSGTTTTKTWSVSKQGTSLQIGYGSGSSFPQYAVLDLSSSYLRMVYSMTSQWGTSVVLLPALWSSTACPTDYCQGAAITVN